MIVVQLLLIPLACGLLLIKPHDTEVLLGQSTYLNCSTSIITEDMHWYHYAAGATALDKREVYAFGKIYEPFLGRFNIDEPLNGTFNLLINSVQEEDAGRYDCQDDGGFGDISSAQLVVLVSYPVCLTTTKEDEVVDPNSCHLEPDKPELSCIVQFRGNIPPVMEWTSLKENVSNIQPNVSQEASDINVTYHLMLKVDLSINGSVYNCQTTRSTSAQLGCSLDPIKILYAIGTNFTANASINEELICSANSSQSCSYRWKWFQDDDATTESRSASLKPTKPGWHKCEADCIIKNQPCTILVMYALVHQTQTEQTLLPNSDSDKAKTILLAVLCWLSILLFSAIIGICFWVRKRSTQSSRSTGITNKRSSTQPQSDDIVSEPLTGLQAAANNDNIERNESECLSSSNKSTDWYQNVVFFAKFTSKLDLKAEEKISVHGVTKMRNKIHVLLDCYPAVPNCRIHVFEDQISFPLQNTIEIKEILFPRDIASIEMENSLYVLEKFVPKIKEGDDRVWKIKVGNETDKREQIITRFELRDYFDKWPSILSVTRDGQLMIVGRRKDDRLWSLTIFREGGSEEGDLRLSIPLPKDIQLPFHAVETSQRNFIILHQKEYQMKEEMEEKICVVSEVSGDGKTILSSFIPKTEEQNLNPSSHFNCHLAVVDYLDRVFLTDYRNNRVILLDSDLHWNGILFLTKEGREIYRPQSLFYDEEKKQLLVGGRNKVFVYTLNRN